MPPSTSRSRTRRAASTIAILTDFGYRDHYVGAMRGVIATIAPDARVIDLTHGIPPQQVIAGAIALRESWRYFPRRTIFLAVVDPGVGTARAPIAIETRAGARFVGPDNGLLSLAANEAGPWRAVKLAAPRYRLTKVSTTFHGRDIFAPAAAWLARGDQVAKLGPRLAKIHELQLPQPLQDGRVLRGEVIYCDGFGNLVTNIDRAGLARFQASLVDRAGLARFQASLVDRAILTRSRASLVDRSGLPGFDASFHADRLFVKIKGSAPMKILDAYGDAPVGSPLATFGSFGMLEIAVRDGSAAARFAAAPGAPVTVGVMRR
jgi:S-adenosylmethionine hydrolase